MTRSVSLEVCTEAARRGRRTGSASAGRPDRRAGVARARRNSNLSGLLVALFAAALNCAGAAAEPYIGPLVDAHGHIAGSFDTDVMIRAVEANGVRAMTLMARAYPGEGNADKPGTDDMALALAAKHPGRFIAMIGMQRPLLTGAAKWHTLDSSLIDLLKSTETKLAGGKFRGIGEVIVRHFAYTPGPHSELDQPIYSTFTLELSRLAAKFDVPLVIHMEGRLDRVADFGRLMRENPTVVYVWAHNCGRSRASVIRDMMTRNPNLMCDLAGMTNPAPPGRGYGTGWPRMEADTALMEENGRFFPDMQAVYEDFSTRLVIGTDIAHAPVMTAQTYQRRISRFRELLGTLSPETARLIAESNAVRIFHLDR